MAFIYIICKDKNEAKKISLYLLKKRLIACSNIFPIESFYWWKGKIEKSKEVAMFVKTKKVNYKKIILEVEKIHSYNIPCICLIEAEANKKYDNWLRKEVKGS